LKGLQLSNETNAADDLTPRQLAYLLRLWRLYKTGGIDHRYNLTASIMGALTTLLFVLSIAGMMREWAPHVIWLLGLCAGMSEALFIATLKFKRLWPAMGCVVDWKRVEAIAASAAEK
jgi:hypothetical protein